MFETTPEKALEFTKLMVTLVFTFPPWPEASKLKKNLFNFFYWIFLANSAILVVALFNDAFQHFDDALLLMKSVCVAVSMMQTVLKMLVCKLKRSSFEVLHNRIREFIKDPKPHERAILQKYLDRASPVHFNLSVWYLIASTAMICGPVVLPQTLPTDAKYPFEVYYHPMVEFIYFHQAIAGWQCAGIGGVDCQAATLIWFAGARLEMLAYEFENATNLNEFNACVRKHQILLKHTEEMVEAIRFVVLVTAVMCTFVIIFGAIHIVSPGDMVMKAQFLGVDISAATLVFLSAWPAENLLSACNAVGEGAYNCPWIKESPELSSNIVFVVLRSQKPAIISVGGILPELSLTYYSALLSKTFSFFTTLRIMVDKSEDDN